MTTPPLLNNTLRKQKIHAPELVASDDVFMQEMTVKDWSIYSKETVDEKGHHKLDFTEECLLLIVLCLKDKKGHSLFTREDIPTLLEKMPARLFQTLCTAAQSVNALDQETVALEKKD